MKEFLLAFFAHSENRPLLVGITIGLFSYLLTEVKAGNTKPIYLGMCCVLGSVIGYFITPLITAPLSKAFGLEQLGNEASQTLLSGYLSFKNLGIVTWLVTKTDKKLEVDGKDN